MLDLPGMGERRGDTPTRVSAIVEECRAQLAAAGVRARLPGRHVAGRHGGHRLDRPPSGRSRGRRIDQCQRAPFSERFRWCGR